MSKHFDDLYSTMSRLRAPGGCPWDREQTYGSLAQYLIEECYELFDAIQDAEATGDTSNLREELGDVLLQVIFHSVIAEERGDFTFDDVALGINEKLILRHPHVFGEDELHTAEDVLNNWDELKRKQREASGQPAKVKTSILDEVPVHFTALLEGQKLTKKAAKINFDWENTGQIFDKLEEETMELKNAIAEGSNIEDEVGDMLFVVLNLARKLDVDAESALKKTNRKFRRRFGYIEEMLKKEGKSPENCTLAELDALWNEAKEKTAE